MTSTREATIEDLPRILELGKKFHGLSPWRDRPFDTDATAQTVLNLIQSPSGVVLFNGDGILGGVLSPIYFGGGMIAQELFWFADKFGQDLIRAFEDWAKQNGADGIIMVNLTLTPRADKIMDLMYRRKGYEMRERHYYKELS